MYNLRLCSEYVHVYTYIKHTGVQKMPYIHTYIPNIHKLMAYVYAYMYEYARTYANCIM